MNKKLQMFTLRKILRNKQNREALKSCLNAGVYDRLVNDIFDYFYRKAVLEGTGEDKKTLKFLDILDKEV